MGEVMGKTTQEVPNGKTFREEPATTHVSLQRSILDIVYLTSTISLTFLWLTVNLTAMLYGNGNVILGFNHYNEGWPEVIMFSLIGGYGVLTVYRMFRR